MTDFRPSAFLRNVLMADAATSAAAGLLMLLSAGFLDTLAVLAALEYLGLRQSVAHMS